MQKTETSTEAVRVAPVVEGPGVQLVEAMGADLGGEGMLVEHRVPPAPGIAVIVFSACTEAARDT